MSTSVNQSYLVLHPSIWSPRATNYFLENLKAGAVFDDFSDLAEEGGNTIYIPTLAIFSNSAVGFNDGEIGATSITDTRVVLNINRWLASPRRVTNANQAQMARSYRLKDMFVKGQADSLARTFDRELLEQSSSFTLAVGDSVTALGQTIIEKAIKLLASESVPLEECVFFIHPNAYWKDLAKVSKYYDASIYGTRVVSKGANTQIWGIPVILTAGISKVGTTPSYRNILAHHTALAYAFTSLDGVKGVSIVEKDSEMLRKTIYAQILYGVKCVRTTGGVKIYSRVNDSG